jgi:hypothetical protein
MYPLNASEYSRMDIIALRDLYNREMDKFKESLLNGTPWEELQQCRLTLTSLSVELHNRLRPDGTNPAENLTRAS